MGKPKVLIVDHTVQQIALDLLSEYDIIVSKSATKENILNNVAGVEAILWFTITKLDKDILDKAGPQLKIVSLMSTGYDHIDTTELKKRNILLGNVSDKGKAVAEVAVLLTLAAMRRAHEGWLEASSGKWEFNATWLVGQDIIGSTVGIVGLGNIGREIAKRLKAFEVKEFLYCGPKEKPDVKELPATYVSFDELLTRSDIVIVSCKYTAETHEIFNAAAFKKMKRTAVFVNISRGKNVVQEDLIEALENHTIFAAGLDVTTPEPLHSGHKLFTLPNCVITPHIGNATINTRNEMASIAARNIIAGFQNRPMPSPVYL